MDSSGQIIEVISGNLTSSQRIWFALLPGIILIAYFVVALMVYTVRFHLYGPYRDEEFENRGSTIITGLWMRLYFAWAIRPLWYVIYKSGIPATAITTLSALLSASSAVALGIGRFSLGGWLFIAGGICDFLDGRVARMRNEATPAGNLLDSVLDRYSDGMIFVGLAWFYKDSWVLGPVLLALTGTFFVSYIRAKGESLGIKIEVGPMQRPERFVFLGVGVVLSPIVEAILEPNNKSPEHRLAVVVIIILAITTHATAARRLIYGLRKLGKTPFKGMASFSKGSLARNLIAALVATGTDFVVFYSLVNYASMNPGLATAIGCVVGAVINFSINRIWVFGSNDKTILQFARYAFVSTTSALLNAGGVTVLLLVPSSEYRIAWVLVRCAVYISWNFPLHRDYVFRDRLQ